MVMRRLDKNKVSKSSNYDQKEDQGLSRGNLSELSFQETTQKAINGPKRMEASETV